MLSNLLCLNACNCSEKVLERKASAGAQVQSRQALSGEDCPDAEAFYDAWQEEMAEIDKMPDKSGGPMLHEAWQPLRQTGHTFCLTSATTCGLELGSCGGPSYASAVGEGESSAFRTDLMDQESATTFVEIQALPVLSPIFFNDDLPGPVSSGPLDAGGSSMLQTSLGGAVSSTSSCVSNEGVMCGREGTDDSGMFFTQWRGRCGFITRLRHDTPEGPWMCHHFTVNGEHCVRAGLGPEHANSCAGVCLTMAPTFQDFTDPPRCMGLRKPLDGPGAPTLIKCSPACVPCCTPSSCAFLSKGRICPFVKKAAADRRAEEQAQS